MRGIAGGGMAGRFERRVALEDLLNRFPEWDVDDDNARLAPTFTVRGWERMPLIVPATVAA